MAIERLVPGTKEWEAFYGNHICRYHFAANQIKHLKVGKILDIACGVGYGTHFLAPYSTEQVIGADISDYAIQEAKKQFPDPKILYVKDDCENPVNIINYAPFDVIVSFETLEHLKNPTLFLQSCYKLLKTDGFFIVSSPNASVTSPAGNVTWKFHEKEYNAEEMVSLVSKAGFSDLKIFGQQYNQYGRLKNLIRSDLNKFNSNPFVRIGKWLQQKLKNHSFGAILPEEEEDMEIIEYPDSKEILEKKTSGPFVLIVTCKK